MTVRVFRDGELVETSPFDPALVAHARDVAALVWADALDPTAEELDALRRAFGLHALSIEDSTRWGQRAKLDRFRDHDFLVVHGPSLEAGDELADRELHLYVGASFLATVRRTPAFELRRTLERLARADPLAREGVGYLLYLVLDEVVDGYLDLVEELEDRTDLIQERVDRDDDGAGAEDARPLAREIFRLRRATTVARRLIVPMREVVDLVQESPVLTTPVLAPYVRDVEDHVIRAIELLDGVRDVLTSAREVQVALESKRLNVIMKQVTSWAAIILIPTLIAGIYGMNFERMPELSWAFGYPFALGLMAATAGALYAVFRRRGWL